MIIRNRGLAADTLVGARGTIAESFEVHRTQMEGGMMRMGPAGDVPVQGNGSVAFEPGGLHVMLIGLREDLKEGMTFPLTLAFTHAGDVTIQVAVRPAAGQPAAPSPMGHG
jgi:copper(I)-binding protein